MEKLGDRFSYTTGMQPRTDLSKLLTPKSKKKGSSPFSDTSYEGILGHVAQTRRDRLQFTEQKLQRDLSNDLQKTMDNLFSKYPDLKNEVFIGILTDKDYQVEVVPLKEAAKAAEDMSEEEALALLKEKPIGYLSSADFGMKTPDNAPMQELRDALNAFFNRNKEIFKVLRENLGLTS